jgi:hypothetical protein
VTLVSTDPLKIIMMKSTGAAGTMIGGSHVHWLALAHQDW